MISVIIVDDHTLFRKGLISILKGFNQIQVIAEAGNSEELFRCLKNNSPDVILLDLSLPDKPGEEILTELKKKYPLTKIVVLSQFFDNATISHLMKLGANAYLSKNCSIEKIANAIQQVNIRGYFFDEKVSEAMLLGLQNNLTNVTDRYNPNNLTKREKEVLKWICQEKKIKEIGELMFLSPRTIDNYIEKLYQKTGVKKREGLVKYALLHNLI